MSYNFATHTAAVLRTYGSSSLRHLRSGSQRYSTILSTRMHPIVRTASARISGLGSCVSCSAAGGGGEGERHRSRLACARERAARALGAGRRTLTNVLTARIARSGCDFA